MNKYVGAPYNFVPITEKFIKDIRKKKIFHGMIKLIQSVIPENCIVR